MSTTSQPVYTLINECHDCYKCIRECPVKAIKVENGHASVIREKCISCGNCVKVCPCNAKRVRSDIDIAKNLIIAKKDIYVSLAPSWHAAFSCSDSEIIAALKKLGFGHVSETALGAQEVSIKTAEILNGAERGLFISSACPVIVNYIRQYKPEFAENITPIASPALTHAKMLKKMFGENIAVVFIGPCVGKKNESDDNKDLIDASLTFEELKLWMEDEFVEIQPVRDPADYFFEPCVANEGSLYPIDGGMNRTINRIGVKDNVTLIEIASLKAFEHALSTMRPDDCEQILFVEALACEGGCIAGPCVSSAKSAISLAAEVIVNEKKRNEIPKIPSVVVDMTYSPIKKEIKTYSFDMLSETLKKLGKYTPEDELNCGGCGYNTCRGLAKAIIDGEAEISMCVSYMRKTALQKASVMIRCMPSAVVMIDADFRILEANNAFIRMFAGEMSEIFESEGISGASLDRIVDFTDIFRTVFKSGRETHKEHYAIGDRLYDITAFLLEKDKAAGAIITDVTKIEMNREKIARKAHEVISKNISIVQEIACLLGEHMVETETLLSSIADGYDK